MSVVGKQARGVITSYKPTPGTDPPRAPLDYFRIAENNRSYRLLLS